MSGPDIKVLTKATLQEDWTTHENISVSTPGAGLAINLDGNGQMVVSFIDGAKVKSAHRNLNVDGNSLRTWNIEDTSFPSSTTPVYLDAILSPSNMTFLAAIGADNKIYVLDCSTRFPQWSLCSTHLKVTPTRLSLFITTDNMLRIAVFDSSKNHLYIVNPSNGRWFLDQAVSSVCSTVTDFKVNPVFARDSDNSIWGYVVSGGVWGKHLDPGVVTVTGDQELATKRPIVSGTYTSVTFASIGNRQHSTTPLIFGIDDSGVATYFQADGNQAGTFTPKFPFSNSTKMKQLDATYRTGVDAEQNVIEWIDLFAIDTSGNLWHTRSAQIQDLGHFVAASRLENGDYAVFNWDTPAIISKKPLSNFDLTINPSGSGPAYLVASDSNTPNSSLHSYIQDMSSTSWTLSSIATINHTADVKKRRAYYVEMTVVKDGVNTPGLLVKITAPEHCEIDANGVSTSVDSVRSYSNITNPYGNLCVTIPAKENMGCSPLTVWVEGMEVDARIDVQPTAEVLSTMADSDLKEVKDQTDGSYVFGGLSDAQISDLEKSLKNVKEAFKSDAPKTGNSNAGKRYIHNATLPALSRSRLTKERHLGFISSDAPGDAFRITLRPNFAFELVNSHETTEANSDEESIFQSWGDFWRSVANGVVTVTEVVITPLAEAVDTTIKVVVEGAKKAWRGITKFVHQAFDVIGELFNAVGVLAKKVFNWLAFLFSWDDIKATAIGLRNVFDTTINNAKNFITNELQPELNGFFSQAKSWLNENLDGALSESDKYKLGDYDKPDPKDPSSKMPSSSSWLSNKVINSAESTSNSQISPVNDKMTSTLQTFINKLNEIGFSDQLTDALKDAGSFFSSITTKGVFDGLTLKAFIKIFKDLVFLLIDLADAALETFLTVLAHVADAFKEMLETPIDIPVISSIFKNLVGLDLTLFNLVAVPLAIPATILFKIVNGTLPFANNSKSLNDEKLASKDTDPTLIWSCLLSLVYGVADTAMDLLSSAKISGYILGSIAAITSFIQVGVGVWSMPTTSGTQAYQRQQYSVAAAGIGALVSTFAFIYGPFGNEEKIFFKISNGFMQFVGMVIPVVYGVAALASGVWHLSNMIQGEEPTNRFVLVAEISSCVPGLAKVLKVAQNPALYEEALIIVDGAGHGLTFVMFGAAILADHM